MSFYVIKDNKNRYYANGSFVKDINKASLFDKGDARECVKDLNCQMDEEYKFYPPPKPKKKLKASIVKIVIKEE